MRRSVKARPPARETSEARRQEIRRLVVEALAKVRATSVSEIWREAKGTNVPLEIDSREAENVISMLEHEFSQELAKVEDLEPEQLTNLDVLVDLIQRRYTGDLEALQKVEGF
jgi:acyl carrier protein